MKLKSIKAIPFAAFGEESGVRWKVTVKEPVVEGERLLVVDFLSNDSCTAYRREQRSFRIACGKKSREVKGINQEGRVSDGVLQSLYRYNQDYILISEREEKALARFLGKGREDTGNHQIDNLSKWVKQTKEEMKRREKQKRGELMDEDYRLCPEALPEGLIDYIRREVLPKDNTLVYKRGNVRGTCFVCGRQVRASNKRFVQGMRVNCPDCGAEVFCVLENSRAFNASFVENIIAAQKGTDGETVFFRQWILRRDPTAQWDRIEDFLQENVRYAVRGRKTAKWQKEYKENNFWNCERYRLREWIRWGDNSIYDGSYFFYDRGIEETLQGTLMQYADLKGYLEEHTRRSKNAVHFLEYHAKYPVMEFLWKAGYHGIVHEKVWGMKKENRNAIRWKREKLRECFRFPLRLLKLKEPQDWTLNDAAKLNTLWEGRGNSLTEKEIHALFCSDVEVKTIKQALPYAGVLKILHYIEKQAGESCYIRGEAGIYRDYLMECEQLGLDLREKEILFPKNLREAHNRTMAQVEFEKNKVDQEKFQKAVEKLEKYAWQKGELFIRPAKAQEELKDEGKALHHCVAGYAKRMANEETAIFFVRRAAEPDKPYFTLELQNKRVIQCRTEHNSSYEWEPEIKAFVDEWIEKIVAKGGNQKKKAKEDAA